MYNKTMKNCSNCKTLKNFSDFYTDKTKANGYTSWCIECKKEKTKLNPRKSAPGASPSLYGNLSEQAAENERARKKKWRKEHPEVVAAINKRVYAKRKKVRIECTSKETRLFMESGDFCVQCLSNEELTLDHIIPMSWENLSWHGLDNFQILCNTCNGTKSNRHSVDLRTMETCVGFDLRNYL